MDDPAKCVWPFRVRHYELGPSGLVRPEVYLNWMQEVGLLASAKAGYPIERYESMGTFWWVRRFRIEWHSAVEYGDSLEAISWISHFGRIRALREYQIRHSENGILVCCAQADWVFIDISNGHPARVPDEMLTSFSPNGLEAVASLPWEWDAPRNDSRPFGTQRVVQYHELDTMGHVNHAFYLAWFLDGLQEHVDGLGIGQSVGIVPERFDIEYLHAVSEGELLWVTCRLLDHSESGQRWQHEVSLRRTGEVVARADSICRLTSTYGADVSSDHLVPTVAGRESEGHR